VSGQYTIHIAIVHVERYISSREHTFRGQSKRHIVLAA